MSDQFVAILTQKINTEMNSLIELIGGQPKEIQEIIGKAIISHQSIKSAITTIGILDIPDANMLQEDLSDRFWEMTRFFMARKPL